MEDNNKSFEDLFKEEETKSVQHLSPGDKVSATVVGVGGETIFLDTGGKSEGILNASELMDSDGTLTVAVGDRVEVYFLQARASEKLFTTKIGSGSSTSHLEEAWRSGIPVEGFVKSEIKGGFEITLGGSVRAFCPYSQMGLRRVDNAAEEYLETHMSFLISRFEENGRNIVVSARAIQEAEREQRKEELKESLAEGQTIEGTVTSLRDFGAFVDIGGVDGLIPLSEVGWSRVENVADYFSVGQQISVVIKNIDWEKDRIALSYKETLADPWETAVSEFTEGSTHVGSVVRLVPFGAFVTLTPGVDGLLHISKLGGGRKINHPREVVEEGQNIEVKIEKIDTEGRKISLAPVDYVGPEQEEAKERAEFSNYTSSKKKESSDGLGSLGQLLKAKLAEKGNK